MIDLHSSLDENKLLSSLVLHRPQFEASKLGQERFDRGLGVNRIRVSAHPITTFEPTGAVCWKIETPAG
jgi:hypothetical protein